jgi:hypothetical protein
VSTLLPNDVYQGATILMVIVIKLVKTEFKQKNVETEISLKLYYRICDSRVKLVRESCDWM